MEGLREPDGAFLTEDVLRLQLRLYVCLIEYLKLILARKRKKSWSDFTYGHQYHCMCRTPSEEP